MAAPLAPGIVRGIFTVVHRTAIAQGGQGRLYRVKCSRCEGEHLRTIHQVLRQVSPCYNGVAASIKHHVVKGKRYGHLVLIDEVAKRPNSSQRRVRARCDCGSIDEYYFGNIYTGHSTQ